MRTHEDAWIIVSQWLVFFAGIGLICIGVIFAILVLLDRRL